MHVEPDADAQHCFGDERQLVLVIEQTGELRHDEDEDDEYRSDTAHGEDRRIDQCASQLCRDPLVVTHLLDRLTQGMRQTPTQLAGLHQMINILGQRQSARTERLSEALPLPERMDDRAEGGAKRRMNAAAGLCQHGVAQGNARLQQGREFVERHDQLLSAQSSAQREGGGALPLVHLDHRVTVGGQGSNKRGHGVCVRPSFHEPAVPIDGFVLVLPHGRHSASARRDTSSSVVYPWDALIKASCCKVRWPWVRASRFRSMRLAPVTIPSRSSSDIGTSS